jgi:hypothetical protein
MPEVPDAPTTTRSKGSLDVRRAAMAGVIGPIGFLTVAFLMSAFRSDVIRAEGWASWPSSMALGGWPGVPQTLAFLWLTACYPVFGLRALRPTLGSGPGSRAAWGGFLAIAAGDLMLAFTTDAAGAGVSWHGSLHLAGVLLVTTATLVAAGGLTFATRNRASWRAWRSVAGVPFAASLIGLIAGFDRGWAKVVYVLGITLPVIVAASLIRRDAGSGDGGVGAEFV